jgi:hypothetical protein
MNTGVAAPSPLRGRAGEWRLVAATPGLPDSRRRPGHARRLIGGPPERRSPRGITAEAGEPYLGHSPASVARQPRNLQRSIKPAQATKWITEARFAPYLAEADDDHDRAVALYVWNAQVSAAMFETLHHVEVALRNAIDAQFAPVIASAPASSTWLCDLAILNETSRRRVQETVARIGREGTVPTRARVVAGLAFGFWRALFDKRYDRLWVSHLYKAFPVGRVVEPRLRG